MECLDCAFATTRPCHWQRHLNSKRHVLITGYACTCGNVYQTKGHLKRHEKQCAQEPVQSAFMRHAQDRDERLAQEQADRDEHIAREFRKQLQLQAERDDRMARESERHSAEIAMLRAEIAARPIQTTHLTNCTFNLSVFLNETCKNAQTIQQFMKSIPLCMDSEQTMDQFILDSLNRCAVEDRPIHCTDLKRGRLAVKNGDRGWEQDQAKVDPLVAMNVNALRQRYVQHLTSVWCPENPSYEINETLNAEWVQFINMMCKDLDAKFLTHVAKVTTIPKE